MTDDPSMPHSEPANSSLDFDRIKAEIDSLDTEIREDTSERLAAQAVIKKLKSDESRLSKIVREWRFQPAKVNLRDLDMAERVILAIYEVLEDDLPRFSSLWVVYRKVRGEVEARYVRVMDALSIFQEILEIYRQRDRRDRPLSELSSDATTMSVRRREVISEVISFVELVRVLAERLDAASQGPTA